MSGPQGILVVDKPAGFTSHDVVAKLRGICQTRKIGHGGTLDPMATGVLPVFVGGAAKAVDLAADQDKAYQALAVFGAATDTGDVTGEVLHRQPCADLTVAWVEAVLPRFLGKQQQVPPLYSAVKVDGKPLYKYAREGQEVRRKSREVDIHSLALLDGEPPGVHLPPELEAFLAGGQVVTLWLDVHCGKGTYVRTLVEDIGKALGVPATLGALRRTRAGVFGLEETCPLEAIQAARDAGALHQLFLPVERVFAELPLAQVDEVGRTRLLNGALVRKYRAEEPLRGRCRVRFGEGAEAEFLGLGRVDEEGTLRSEKLFVERGE